jgi:guanidinopropionase
MSRLVSGQTPDDGAISPRYPRLDREALTRSRLEQEAHRMTDPYRRPSPVTGEEINPIDEVRYFGVPTFMRAPLATDLEGLDIALVGVPFDAGATNRPGTRHGPREIRNQSSLTRRIHPTMRIDPFVLCRVADVGDVRFDNVFSLEAAHGQIESFFARLHEAGVVPLTAGGDHSITYPILRAIAPSEPVGLIQVDSHPDTWDEFMGSRIHHGAPFRRAVEEKLIDPRRTVQIGLRGPQNDTEGWDFSVDSGMRVIFMDEVARIGIDEVIAETRRVGGDGPLYLSFDIDGLDPAFAPGTGTPEIGGLTTLEAQTFLRGLRGLQLVGADVVEVSPPFDPSGNTALAGAGMMYELLCLLAEARSGRRDPG